MRRLTPLVLLPLLVGCIGVTTSCFVSGTPVRTPGGPRAIEELRPGDEVLSFRESDGAIVTRRVTHVHRAIVTRVRVLEVEGRAIVTTDEHPFWDAERRAWLPAREISCDAVLVMLEEDGSTRPCRVLGARDELRASIEVWNLTVEGPEHTFFASGVATHNKSPVENCGVAECGPSAPSNAGLVIIENDTGETVSVSTRAPHASLRLDRGVLDGSIAPPLDERLFELPTSVATLAPGASTAGAGRVALIGPGGEATMPSLGLFLDGGRSFLILGEGHVVLRMRDGAVVPEAADPRATTVVAAAAAAPVCASDPAEPRLTLNGLIDAAGLALEPVLGPSADGCLQVSFVEPEGPQHGTMRACMPEDAWPFAPGEKVVIGRTFEIQSNEAVRLTGVDGGIVLELGRLDIATATVQMGARTLGIDDASEASCATVGACGMVTVPATIWTRDASGASGARVPMPERQAVAVDATTTHWLLGASLSPVVRTDCVPEDAPSGRGSIELAVVIRPDAG